MDSPYQSQNTSEDVSIDDLQATSPSDTRAPSRYESITGRDDAGLSESYASSDTIRRRPDTGAYGTCYLRIPRLRASQIAPTSPEMGLNVSHCPT